MRISPRSGYCIISADPTVTISKGGILYPNALTERPCTGFVHIHAQTVSFDEDLTGKHIIFDKAAARPFRVNHHLDGKEYEFFSISQWAVLAILERHEGEV